MTADQLWWEYYRYLYQMICGVNASVSKTIQWKRLTAHLFQTPFRYSYIAMDGNRLEDGLALRDRFGDYAGHSQHTLTLLDQYECSVLEVMIALALRMEEETMASSEFGDRTNQWFWYMIVSLGLSGMTDTDYNADYVDMVLNRFMDREYSPDGNGSLFYVPGTKKDFRNIEIWYQMCEYLNSIIKEGR